MLLSQLLLFLIHRSMQSFARTSQSLNLHRIFMPVLVAHQLICSSERKIMEIMSHGLKLMQSISKNIWIRPLRLQKATCRKSERTCNQLSIRSLSSKSIPLMSKIPLSSHRLQILRMSNHTNALRPLSIEIANPAKRSMILPVSFLILLHAEISKRLVHKRPRFGR